MSQSSLWQLQTDSGHFAELCNGLYQREITRIALESFNTVSSVQVRLKSLPYYVNRTVHAMTKVVEDNCTPLLLDYQNATWSAKQSKTIPVSSQESKAEQESRLHWYSQKTTCVGLVVPVLSQDHIFLDCIDRIDLENKRIRTNVSGWFSLNQTHLPMHRMKDVKYLLKPTKKIMIAACTGQRWHGNTQHSPIIPSLRELLLSCSINWRNFKKPLTI